MGSYTGQRRQASCACGWVKFALLGVMFFFCFQVALCDTEPTESQCRPYIEKALKEQHTEERITEEILNQDFLNEKEETPPTDELTDSTEGSTTNEDEGQENSDVDNEQAEVKEEEDDDDGNEDAKTEENDDADKNIVDDMIEDDDDKDEEPIEDKENDDNEGKHENTEDQTTEADITDDDNVDDSAIPTDTVKSDVDKQEKEDEDTNVNNGDADDDDTISNLETPINIEIQEIEMNDNDQDNDDEITDGDDDTETHVYKDNKSAEDDEDKYGDNKKDNENDALDEKEINVDDNDEKNKDEGKEEREADEAKEENETDEAKEENETDEAKEENETDEAIEENETDDAKDENETDEAKEENVEGDIEKKEDEHDSENEPSDKKDDGDEEEKVEKKEAVKLQAEGAAESGAEEDTEQESPEEEELINEMVIPENLRPRDHIDKILRLEDSGLEAFLEKTIDSTLKALKGLYDNAIKPLEMLYKYRDLSNRHFGDPEIFSKPLILFMGPWSGGKSSTINYLLNNEFSRTSLRTGAEPSPAYFNILMFGEEEEILDGTQLAADWTFSGLQKFGQSLLDRLKGVKLPNKLLEKVNIVEIPGILEIRKQVQRLFPFNDACQWFIDRADIIFLVYDPSKLDVGPETEAILDQLKGREYQTRIILNKADQVKPEELMRVQGTLIWNISPLMSSSEPPIMYSTSLWSLPYEIGAPTRLLQAQERAFLRDLREAIDKRVENKISSARRFAVRVRNHAKMVDCYLTTYYNHKTIFGNRKRISDDIIEYPQKYHIYEGLSTLTNISRYDLPDPDVYRDFFKINPLYEFKKLSETCTYFRGCPINKLDVAIAYDLPELVGKYKKAVEAAKEQLQKENS